ncbi:IclR family transcriptional regulator [halophilic archaeon]|nr:IclR family transcriptional regulator [halophilic archaeon]
MDSQENRNQLRTLERAFLIMDTLKDQNGGRVTEIATYLDLPKSTVHNHLSTLHQLGYLVKEGDEYHIGLKSLDYGGYAANRKKSYRMARGKVKELANETNERAQFIVEEHGRGIYVHQETGSHAVQADVRLGKITHLHTVAAGKAILAHLPTNRVDAILANQGLPKYTENTIINSDKLKDELSTIRERGWAYNRGERISKQTAVGVPLTSENNTVIGAFSISGPKQRIDREQLEDKIPNLLLGAVNELELNIAFND